VATTQSSEVDEEALARLAARDSEEISMSRHIGILQVADGRRWYTSVNPDVQRLTGCEEGTMRGLRLDLWRDGRIGGVRRGVRGLAGGGRHRSRPLYEYLTSRATRPPLPVQP
jgi:hypothetical protein